MHKYRYKLAIIIPMVIGAITMDPVLALFCFPVTLFTAWTMVEL